MNQIEIIMNSIPTFNISVKAWNGAWNRSWSMDHHRWVQAWGWASLSKTGGGSWLCYAREWVRRIHDSLKLTSEDSWFTEWSSSQLKLSLRLMLHLTGSPTLSYIQQFDIQFLIFSFCIHNSTKLVKNYSSLT